METIYSDNFRMYAYDVFYPECIKLDNFTNFVEQIKNVLSYEKKLNERIVVECLTREQFDNFASIVNNAIVRENCIEIAEKEWNRLIEDANVYCVELIDKYDNLIFKNSKGEYFEVVYLPISFWEEEENWKGERLAKRKNYIAAQVYRKVSDVKTIQYAENIKGK